MNRTELIARLRAINACSEALTWIEQTPGEPDDLWAACQRGDWLLWLLVAVGYDERTMRHLACDFAEGVLPIYERAYPGDRRPCDAIAVARRYADGAATYDELIAASAAAGDAALDAAKSAADYAAGAAVSAAAWATSRAAARAAADAAAKAASWATARAASDYAASDAAWAAAWYAAGAAARDAAIARHADIIRARVSWADVEALLAQKAEGRRGWSVK